MTVRLIEGLHLTATNKRHLAEIIGKGWTEGHSGRIAYSVAPIEGEPHRFRYHWRKRERDDFDRPVTREGRGIIECRGDPG
ncbi:MAG: hypothetical protein B7X90_11820 [Novosphingobium sp. 17-62-19]|uniref:hypothetical protein n=1 Tax=Novosphingobium sp. 17-62-19 TaxID=1970406 RepID=UPI000BD42E31|nr:hypothetical protein [Novosphingobium sp. 17-62-19]OYX96363.1 MAG: hypothetical protein B7Y74_01525 [Novosphingobium sp. 35-62-5]OZA18585.1 MAG: hypothetical protein B7X90_11820 [Novosphingobium sp. 17-62-19]OZA63033.1 MAG: hypothetical protein B7X78_05810 [Sphingomonadales bacterium 39-62-4]HQS98335.1 hypothetical protein [Novosphingobium sp.]